MTNKSFMFDISVIVAIVSLNILAVLNFLDIKDMKKEIEELKNQSPSRMVETENLVVVWPGKNKSHIVGDPKVFRKVNKDIRLETLPLPETEGKY